MSQATLSDRPYVNANLFSGHYLDERVQEREEWDCDDDARDAMDDLQTLYELEGSLVEGYGEDALIDNWIDEVLDILGFGTQEEVTLPNGGGHVDELLFETTTARRDAAGVYLDTKDTTDLFERGVGIVEAKQWDAAFDVTFSEQRPYRNASHQTKHYLENTPPNIQWGVLTNGRKWRLYGTNDYETQTYYEVDLPELLERGDLKAFKYFFVFFRSPAFHESGGTTFLDEVWSESETASQELGESLQDNVFTALRVLGRGFVETNDDLDIDPDDEDAMDELKEQSLVFLYRLMFVLYAEARGLIHPEGQSAQDEYDQNFSLDELRLDIHDTIGEVDEGFEDEFSDYSTTMWHRLEDLFRLIDEGEDDLGIPPYNGGLFDHEEHDFLTEHGVSNRYLAEVIYRLSTTQNEEGRYVLADYADLDTRHLGSVYEGLLEHQFRIAPEGYAAVAADGGQVWKPATEVSVADAVETVPEDGLYVVNDEGERKATGAYYTPDYVVTYIVEETVGPLVEEIREDLIDQGFEPGTQEYIGPFFRRVTDLRILDPAMGSGHFLTKATGYLSEQVMAEVREAETEFGVAFDEQHIRREIAKECIYGVDLNGMAVELAKLSMWLETLAANRPLAFLDHHFKQGNSLIGSNIEDIEELESDANGDNSQYSLAEFGATREGTIERLMDIYSEFLAIENETVEDVREMKRKYAEIEQDELRRRLVAMANVHTAEGFGLEVPSGAYERMAKALEDDSEWEVVERRDWYTEAQSMAEEYSFFYWRLEYPEVYYNESGSERDDLGFDVVIGNPPYGKQISESHTRLFNSEYNHQEYQLDRYLLFIEKCVNITRASGAIGLIIPNTWLTNLNFGSIRSFLLNQMTIQSLVEYDKVVFEDATVEPISMTLRKKPPQNTTIQVETRLPGRVLSEQTVEQSIFQDSSAINVFAQKGALSIKQKFSNFKHLGDICEVHNGVKPFEQGKGTPPQTKEIVEEKPYISEEKEDDTFRPLLRGSLIEQYLIKWDGEYWISYGEWLAAPRDPSIFNADEKIVIRQTGDSLIASLDNEQFVVRNNMHAILPQASRYNLSVILSLINSTFANWYYQNIVNPEKGEALAEVKRGYVVQLPVPELDSDYIGENCSFSKEEYVPEDIGESVEALKYINNIERNTQDNYDSLVVLPKCINIFKSEKREVNTSLIDYLGSYVEGPTLSEFGIYHPPEGIGNTKLVATITDYENIRIGTVICKRESENTVLIHATARYKPDDESAHETDRWGYTETEPMPAMRLTDLSETEADLVEAFVPVAVEKAGGFAGFRETATKTNSLVDRLEAITLPDPDDVADDLERYREAVERAEELDEKIQRTNDLIDEIVYDLYGLTDAEIEIVEDAVEE